MVYGRKGCGCSTCSGGSSNYSYGGASSSYPAASSASSYASSYGSSYASGYPSAPVVPYAAPSSGCRCATCVAPAAPSPPCHLSCSTAVRTETQYTPQVSVRNVCKQDTSFDVELDICAKPRCYISQQPSIQSCDPCRHTCKFTVALCCPVSCTPRITNCAPGPSANFDLVVDIDTKSRCMKSGSSC